MEASTLTATTRFGRIARRSPLLRLQGDERLIALTRAGHDRAFEALVERYQARLHAFCRGMLGSAEDAEDVLQEVFVAAHAAILADNRKINARPWLYRIARNRCLNHLRKPVAEGQDSMDTHPHEHGVSVAERVQKREDFRALVADVQDLPETQRTALLLRELDALSYEEIAHAMDTTVPAVKSLLVRARMSLAECSQARHLTCDEVNLELAEAAEGLRKVSGPVRAHLRRCERCREYRAELRRSERSLAALAPLGPIAATLHLLGSKLGIGAGTSTAGGTAMGGAAAAGSGGAGVGALGAAGGAVALGGKAVAGFASVALLTAGAVEVNHIYREGRDASPGATSVQAAPAPHAPTGATGAWAPPIATPAARPSGAQAATGTAAPRREPKANAGNGAPAPQATEPATSTPPSATATTPPATSSATTPATTPPAAATPPATDAAVTGTSENGGGVAGPAANDSGTGTVAAEPEEPAEPTPPAEPSEPAAPAQPAAPAKPDTGGIAAPSSDDEPGAAEFESEPEA